MANGENKLQAANTLPALMKSAGVKRRFSEMLGKNASGFLSALLTIYQNSKMLQDCSPASILGAAGMAAALNLSITPSLGHAYVVPYKGQAQFQIGYKGLIQLAHRTRQYTTLHSGVIREGEIKGVNPITGELERGEKISDEVVGYVAYMRTVDGFEKALYMTVEEMQEHAANYSQSYAYDLRSNRKTSIWSKNFDAMAKKTVLKLLLNKWGVLSQDMWRAIQTDQAVVNDEANTLTYVDNSGHVQSRDDIYFPEETIDAEVDSDTGEVTEVTEAKAAEVVQGNLKFEEEAQ